MTRYFNEWFADGTLDAWNLVNVPSVQAVVKLKGANAMMHDALGEYIWRDFDAGTPRYIKGEAYFNNLPTPGNVASILSIKDNANGEQVSLRIRNNGGVFEWGHLRTGGASVWIAGPPNPAVGIWYTCEIYMHSDTVDIWYQIWIDEVSIISTSWADDGSTISRAFVGCWVDAEVYTIYWDSIIVSNTYNGPGWKGTIMGISIPAKVMGIEVEDIASIIAI